jgi:hypothetical protein
MRLLADLRAEKRVDEYRVAVIAVTEGDELQTIDGDHVIIGENDVVHAFHVAGSRTADSAGKAPLAAKENGVPGSDKSGG